MKPIPVCEPVVGKREAQYVLDCIKTNWISSRGKYLPEFEKKFAAYCGLSFGVATTSGTTALHLALASLGITEGDEVILPDFTMISSILAVVYTGARPVLVDAEPDTWCMSVSGIRDKINKKTKAIMPVHIYGHPCDMDPILKLAKEHGLSVVEDAAEAHGAEYKGRKAGALGDIGCFSFYANKIITTGEGGMLVTSNKKLAQKAALLKDLAFQDKKRYLHEDIGFNYRMTNIQAAIGLAQLERIDEFVRMRRGNAQLYSSLLEDIEEIVLPVEKPWAKNCYWMYGVLVRDIGRETLRRRLMEKGIDTRAFFVPMHQQPVFKRTGRLSRGRYPVAEYISKRGFYLPSGSSLGSSKIKYICRVIKEALYRLKHRR